MYRSGEAKFNDIMKSYPPEQQPRRRLQEEQQDTGFCSLCRGSLLLADVFPEYDDIPDVLPNQNCAYWDALAAFVTAEDCVTIQLFLYDQCCLSTVPRYTCEKTTRDRLLENYDSVVPPVPVQGEMLEIKMELIFIHVTEINEPRSTAEVFVWLILQWNDPRLAWHPSTEECATQISMLASIDAEKTEIWVPDLDLYNQVQGVQQLPDAKADVFADGTIIWRRHGPLIAICSFSGLSELPFDTVGCDFLFGMWERQNGLEPQFNISLGVNDGFGRSGLSYGDFGVGYTQYQIIKDLSTVGVYPDEFGQDEVYYTFYFSRATQHYIYNIILPTVILTYVSFGTFLLDIRSGERLSYGMSLALVIVAHQIVANDLLPVSSEQLWMDKLVAWSFYFVVVGLIESVVIGYVHHLDDEEGEETETEGKRELEQTARSNSTSVNQNSQTVSRDNPSSDANAEGSSVSHTTSDAKHPSIDANATENDVASRDLHADSAGRNAAVAVNEDRQPQSRRQTLAGGLQRIRSNWRLRHLDHIFFVVLMMLYTIFLIVMFTTLPLWAQEDWSQASFTE